MISGKVAEPYLKLAPSWHAGGVYLDDGKHRFPYLLETSLSSNSRCDVMSEWAQLHARNQRVLGRAGPALSCSRSEPTEALEAQDRSQLPGWYTRAFLSAQASYRRVPYPFPAHLSLHSFLIESRFLACPSGCKTYLTYSSTLSTHGKTHVFSLLLYCCASLHSVHPCFLL